MQPRSSRHVGLVLCATTLVVLSQPNVAAQRPPLAASPPQAEPTFDMSSVVGAGSCANALTELGTVVGIRKEFGIFHAFSWSPDRGVTQLEPDTNALAVNDYGEIAGQGDVSGSGLQALVWTRAGSMRVAVGVAYSLNNRTEVVGFHLPPGDSFPLNHGFRWTPTAGLEDVESLTGATPPWSPFAPLSTTRFIRADGVMAGERGGFAVLWQPDGRLTTLGQGVAHSVNDLGVAVGATSLSNGYPVVWRDGSQTVITDAVGEATDVNTAGYVVGWVTVGGERHGFLWHPLYGLQDLGPGQARNIDEIGDIAGCRGTGDESRATVWQVQMTDAEYLVGFESVARRLLADVDTKSSRGVFREIELAQRAVERTHGKVARHHLERAVMEIGDLARTGMLAPAWAESLQRIGRWITGRL
jgi:probable HAF family extracellular repeat protein